MRKSRSSLSPSPSPVPKNELIVHDDRNCMPTGINFFHHVLNERDAMLVEYCLFSFLPSQYHQAADGKPTIDLSYLRYLCLESHLLLNAVSACAMVGSKSAIVLDHSRESSHKLYMAAISEISAGIAKGTLTGTEDSLLATVIWLCVYEVRFLRLNLGQYSLGANDNNRIRESRPEDRVPSMLRHCAEFSFYANQWTTSMLPCRN